MSEPTHRSVAGRLRGETALVTGSTSGLGAEIASLFAAAGASVIVTGRNEAAGAAVVADVRAGGGEARFIGAELTEEDERAALVAASVEAYGPLTVLVNNASGRLAHSAHLGKRMADLPFDAWEALVHMNLTAPASLCRLAIPHMLAAGHGSIVNVTSRTAQLATTGTAAYTSAKGGLNALGRSITADYARCGIRCNAVQPGHIEHDRDSAVAPEVRAEREAMHLTRLTTARDVAYAALFLAGPEAETISGIVLQVDGGSTAVRARTLG